MLDRFNPATLDRQLTPCWRTTVGPAIATALSVKSKTMPHHCRWAWAKREVARLKRAWLTDCHTRRCCKADETFRALNQRRLHQLRGKKES